jgi:hypothetical protein
MMATNVNAMMFAVVMVKTVMQRGCPLSSSLHHAGIATFPDPKRA